MEDNILNETRLDEIKHSIDSILEESISEESITHHGIIGQKWGIRRFQNKDGSLTPRGRKRYEGADDKEAKEARKAKSSLGSKSVKDMSDDELRKAISRAQLEKQYNDLNPKKVSAGKKFMDDAVVPAIKSAAKSTIQDYLTKTAKKLLGLEDEIDPDDKAIKTLRKQVDKLNLEKQYKDLTKTESETDKYLRDLDKAVKGLSREKQFKNLVKELYGENSTTVKSDDVQRGEQYVNAIVPLRKED